jgi:hypothetical protein
MAFSPPSLWQALLARGGDIMAKPLLPDDLWELIEPLLPPPKPRRRDHPGRKCQRTCNPVC